MRSGRPAIARLLLVLGTLVILLFLCGLLYERPIPEPHYGGKSLSEWLALYPGAGRNGGVPTEAELAVRAVGTNALPFLLTSLRYELPAWRKGLLKLATRPVEGKTLEEGKVTYGRSRIVGKNARKTTLADMGFIILGTNAVSAIPELEALMKNNRKPDNGVRAIYALGEIGGPAIAVLTNALADPKQANREDIFHALYRVELESDSFYGGKYRGACFPALLRALEDPDEEVRREARVTLYNLELHHLTPSTATNAPARHEQRVELNTP